MYQLSAGMRIKYTGGQTQCDRVFVQEMHMLLVVTQVVTELRARNIKSMLLSITQLLGELLIDPHVDEGETRLC